MRVLNVGGGPRTTAMPKHYEDWEQVWLDIDASLAPDLIMDARRLDELDANSFDAVYCSHNLEHYYPHDVPKVLRGFRHVIGSRGVVEIIVPDIAFVVKHMVENGMDLEDELYESAVGPITIRDVIYGYGKEIEESGHDFYAHKTGFTPRSLDRALKDAGFPHTEIRSGQYFEVHAFAALSKEHLDRTKFWQRFYP